jgi:hypothetical protein
MNTVNQKIIQAVIEKANQICPDLLEDNIKTFDKYLQKYEQVYQQAGISVKRYSDVEGFAADYLRK